MYLLPGLKPVAGSAVAPVTAAVPAASATVLSMVLPLTASSAGGAPGGQRRSTGAGGSSSRFGNGIVNGLALDGILSGSSPARQVVYRVKADAGTAGTDSRRAVDDWEVEGLAQGKLDE